MLGFLSRLAPVLVLTLLGAACSDDERKPLVYADPPRNAGGTGGSSDGAGGDPSGGTNPSGGTGGGAPAVRTGSLDEVLLRGDWSEPILRQFSSIAVDGDEQVWIASEGAGLFVVKDGKDSSFVSVSKLLSDGLIDEQFAGEAGVHDVEVDAAGHLYLLVPGAVLEFTSGGSFESLREFSDTGNLNTLGAGSRGLMAALDPLTLWTISSADVMATYQASELGSRTDCYDVDLAMHADGTTLFSPGCVGSALWLLEAGGGEPVKIISGVEELTDIPLGIQSYDCIAVDPNGGFYVITNDIEDHVHLYHVDSGDRLPTDLSEVMVESLDDTGIRTEFGQAASCGLAATPEGDALYVEHARDLYRISL